MIILGKVRPLSGRLLGPHPQVLIIARVEVGETLMDALTRELHEETGLVIGDNHVPKLVWIQTVPFPEMNELGYGGVSNHYFLAQVEKFEPTSGVPAGTAGHPDSEGIRDQRWWSVAEIEIAHIQGVLFSPRALPTLLRAVLMAGPPPTPIMIGL